MFYIYKVEVKKNYSGNLSFSVLINLAHNWTSYCVSYSWMAEMTHLCPWLWWVWWNQVECCLCQTPPITAPPHNQGNPQFYCGTDTYTVQHLINPQFYCGTITYTVQHLINPQFYCGTVTYTVQHLINPQFYCGTVIYTEQHPINPQFYWSLDRYSNWWVHYFIK